MTVPAGFHVELVASEPDIVNPIAMTFDDRDRLFITESVEYPRAASGPGRDCVRIVEGEDQAGHARRVTTFVDGLNIPTGIAVGYGGVWVLNAPDLLFFREKDGKAISREVVLTGFGREDTHELPSSLTWGPDGWLYGLNGVFNGSHVVDSKGKRHDFTCAMWRLNPRTRDLQVFAQGTSNPYGIAWDAEGSAIIEVCHWANDHLFHFVETGYYQRQAGAYPPFAMPIGSITDHGHQKTAYCGIAYLDTDAFPAAYRGRVCVGNIHGGCVNADHLLRDGATYLAKGDPDLLTANDVWFMPVSLKIGPDGCLYVLDWYDRYHCAQDASRDPAGVDRTRGRLYRLRYGNTPKVAGFDLSSETDDQLLHRLAGPNIYFRQTAQRLLTERLSSKLSPRPSALRSALEKCSFDPGWSREARLHALWALIGSGGLDPEFHARLLTHPDPAFRAWGVRGAGNYGAVTPAIRQSVVRLARDASADVQLQVAIASRKMEGVDALPLLLDVLAHCGQDRLIPAIVWPNLHPLLETESGRLARLVNDDAPRGQALPPGIAALMARMIDRSLSARRPDLAAIVALLKCAIRSDPRRAPECVAAVAGRIDALDSGTLLELKQQLGPTLQQLLSDTRDTPLGLSAALLAARLHIGSIDAAEVRRRLVSSSEPPGVRLQALDALIAFRDPALLDVLPGVLESAPPELTTQMLASLGRLNVPRLADVILATYPKLAPELQPLAIDLLMQREPWARKLLDAVLAGTMPRGALNANYLRKILDSDDREAIWAVEKAYGQIREERNPEREKVVAEMGRYLRANLGDPVAGQRVFKNLCAQCHTIYGQGAKIGPDITANGRSSFEQLLSNVFDPSLVIGPGYQVVTVVTRDGRNLTGLLAEDSEQRVVVRIPGGGEEVIVRNDVKYTRRSKLSMMPEGIENLLSRHDLADLFAFLSLDKPPSDPTASPIPGAPFNKQWHRGGAGSGQSGAIHE